MINSLANNKILDQSKFRAFADHKINVTKEFNFFSGKAENIVGKGENAGYQHFLLFPQCFQKVFLPASLTVGITWLNQSFRQCFWEDSFQEVMNESI